jgi:uncharacterized protein (TIGR02145 family)
MKEVGISHWASPNIGATNSSGFTGLPGGWRNYTGSFNQLTLYGIFWSSTAATPPFSYYFQLSYSGIALSIGLYGNVKVGYSVRLVKD